jgi:prepilin-type N-terminal cleavage/methylation domain-containing protein
VRGGFTLAEVVVAVAVLTLMVAGLACAYVQSADRAEWSAYSLAAQSLACQGMEQARAAKWDPQAWPPGIGRGLADELGLTNYVQTNVLDLPVSGGQAAYATNFISITQVSTNPEVRQIRSDCVWRFARRGGLFTNTVITLRAADQ